MRHKPLRTVMLAGTLFAAGGSLLHQLLLESPLALNRWVPTTGAILVSIRQWIELTLAHISPTEFATGVEIVWFILVLTLLFRSCADRPEPPRQESQIRISLEEEYGRREASTAILADPMQVGDTLSRRSFMHLPASGITTRPRLRPPHRPPLELPYGADDNVPSNSAEVSQVNGNSLDLSNGYLLTLNRIVATERGWAPYSFFVVAECVGRPTSISDGASWRTVDAIVCQFAPLLAHDTTVAHEPFSALFEMAPLRASSAPPHDGIRTAAEVTVLVAGVMVIGAYVYVVNFRHRGVYLFHSPG